MSGATIYAYGGSNPLSNIDPSGQFAILLPALPAIGEALTAGAGYLLGGIAMATTLSMSGDTSASSKADTLNCPGKKDDDDPCDIILDKGQLKSAGIKGREHEVKADELGTNKNLSKFDLCGCRDGRVVVKAHGCKGPVISVTDYRWK